MARNDGSAGEGVDQTARLAEEVVGARIDGQGHRFLAEVDSDQPEWNDPHPAKLEVEDLAEHRIVARSDRLRRDDERGQANRQSPPGRESAVGGAGDPDQEPFISRLGAVNVDRLPDHSDHALGGADDRHPVQPDSPPVIAEHVQRRLAELLSVLRHRVSRLQNGIDQLDELVLDHGDADSPGLGLSQAETPTTTKLYRV